MKCPRCGAMLSCGCQKKRLPNGTIGCKYCAKNNVEPKIRNNARRMRTRI